MNASLDIIACSVLGGFGCELPDLANAIAHQPGPQQRVIVHDNGRDIVYPAHLADLDNSRVPRPAGMRRADRFARLTLALGGLALSDCPTTAPERQGIIVATGYGSHETMQQFAGSCRQFGDAAGSPLLFSNSGYAAAMSHLTIQQKLAGPSLTVFQPDLAFTAALLCAWMWLTENRADQVLLVAVEECNHVVQWAHHQSLNGQPAEVMRPLDFAAHTPILADGGAAFVLQRSDPDASPLAVLKSIKWFNSPEGIADAPSPLLLAAAGMRDTAAAYQRCAKDTQVYALSPAFGTLPTGIALTLAGMLALWNARVDHPLTSASVVRAVECSPESDTGLVTLSRR